MRLSLKLTTLLVITVFVFRVAFAAGQTFDFDDPKLSITIPSDFMALTRDVSPDDPVLQALGLDYGDFLSELVSKRIYVSAYRLDPFAQIDVSLWQDEFSIQSKSFSNLSDSELDARAVEYMKMYESEGGLELTGYEIFKSKNAVFLVYDIIGGSGVYISGKQYQTVFDGVCVNITMITNTPVLGEYDEIILKETATGMELGGGSPWGNVVAALGMLVVGASTMVGAQKRLNKQKAEQNEKKRQRELSKIRPAYCPNCGAKMTEGSAVCNECLKSKGV